MSAYQDAGNAYQGTGLFAYQGVAGVVGVFGDPLEIRTVGGVAGRVGDSAGYAADRIGGSPAGRKRIGG